MPVEKIMENRAEYANLVIVTELKTDVGLE
jgi:hypothetical protein